MSRHRHRWNPRASITAVSGFVRFHAKIERLTGHRLPHPGYTLFECSCGEWRIRDYCGGAYLPLTADAAKELM